MSRTSVRLSLVSRRELVRGAAALGALGVAACAGEEDGKADDTGPYVPLTIDPITPNEDFYVTSCCGTPEVDGATWSLSVRAGGVELTTVDLAGLDALTPRDKEHTLECIGAGPYAQAIGNAVWTGLPLLEILAQLGVEVPDSAVEIKLTSADEYTTSLPISDLDKPVWLVWRMNGEALPDRHGYPARLLVPGRYGMKNPKWIVALDFVDEPYLGFWESTGWSNDASYQANTLIRDPRDNQAVPEGQYRIVGTAFAGSDPVESVEISFDGGATWEDVTIDYSPGADVWTLWHVDWIATPGVWDIKVRCTCASGATSNENPDGTGYLDGYDGSMLVTVAVDEEG